LNSSETNTVFTLAAEFINNTSRSVFLTGKAGTGKTTFLKYICSHSHKNLAVAAPTGVAAINAGGMTLHSLFQLPIGVYLPGFRTHESSVAVTNRNTLFKNLKLSAKKRELLQELELLIIDEVSMVRCDMLDAVDAILRMVRRNQRPFGGVQVLFIGDLFQLSPVAGNEEWNILKEHYESPFFFHAKAVQQSPPVSIELTKIYRQSDQRFIDLLNNIRNNEVTEYDFEVLNSRLGVPSNHQEFVTLSTHNYKADAINERELEKLDGTLHQFNAVVQDDFPERNFPTESVLSLKLGARIMFIKNDSSEEKRYYNGKLATVIHIENDSIVVQDDQGITIELTKETWRNIRYKYNAEDDEIIEEELGAFTQYPIRLAWAITIHKSQGLTFEKAIIDAGSSFAPGQVYVALSRCTSLDGLVLQTPITPRQIATDPIVVEYSKNLQNELQLKNELQQAVEEYEIEYFLRLFNFNKIQQAVDTWALEIPGKKIPNLAEAKALSKTLQEKANSLLDIAGKTQHWIEKNFHEARQTGAFTKLIDGLTRSVNHFNAVLHDDFFEKLQEHYSDLKGQRKVKKYRTLVFDLATTISGKAKKIRQAAWRNQLLFTDDTKVFTELIESGVQKVKGSSAWETLALFQRGLDVQKIADMRGLAISTIESHLLEHIRSGKLPLAKFVTEEKIKKIEEVISSMKDAKTAEIKIVLGDGYSFNEIRAVLFYRNQTRPAAESN
jgi:hypothetical protein